jgi:hypothetical protein
MQVIPCPWHLPDDLVELIESEASRRGVRAAQLLTEILAATLPSELAWTARLLVTDTEPASKGASNDESRPHE